MKKLVRSRVLVLLIGIVHCISIPPATGQSFTGDKNNNLALVGAKIYPSPTDKPINKGTVLIRDGKIVALGETAKIKVPDNMVSIDCTGLTLVAGFWNCHVHFIEKKWENAASLAPSQLNQQLQNMLTKFGFTTVFDTGSSWDITKTIRDRIESGVVNGPMIFSTGAILFPKGGLPPANLLEAYGSMARNMPEVENAQQAISIVRQELKSGVDGIKIYAQTWWDPNLKMSTDIVKAITSEAHRQGKLVFVHPSGSYGLETAIESGADVLTHTTPSTGPWSKTLITRMKQDHLSLIPTLKLWRVELEKAGTPPDIVQRFRDTAVSQLQTYFEAGGQILFGTDLGYVTDYDPTEEYQQMERANMRFPDILASLTTAPAKRFDKAATIGRIAPGMNADIVLLAGDPTANIEALSNIKYTLRNGKIIYESQ
jgi:imidazolonepropionase-like amidohydrolase